MKKAILILTLMMLCLPFSLSEELPIEEKKAFLYLNIYCTEDHDQILLKGYTVCEYIPNLNKKLIYNG